MIIVFIGADGSGKTAVSRLLASKLSSKFKSVRYYHTRFGIVSGTGIWTFVKRIISRKKQAGDPRQKEGYYDYPKPHSALKASIIFLLVSFDYLLGHFVANKYTKKSNLLIFDRYFYEFFTEEPFKNQSIWMLKIFQAILPKPDLVVFLYNTPEIIFKRKSEQSIDQIRAKNKRNQQLIRCLPYGITIKTDDSIDEIASKIQGKVLDII